MREEGKSNMSLPLFNRKPSQKTSNKQSSDSVTETQRLYGICRNMQQRLNELEATLSILKRDVARIDRKQYRESEGEIIPKQPVKPVPVPDDTWFGLRIKGGNDHGNI